MRIVLCRSVESSVQRASAFGCRIPARSNGATDRHGRVILLVAPAAARFDAGGDKSFGGGTGGFRGKANARRLRTTSAQAIQRFRVVGGGRANAHRAARLSARAA